MPAAGTFQGRTLKNAASLAEDADMVLATADLGIASRYASLAGEAGHVMFPLIREEFDRTVEHLLAVRGTTGYWSRTRRSNGPFDSETRTSTP